MTKKVTYYLCSVCGQRFNVRRKAIECEQSDFHSGEWTYGKAAKESADPTARKILSAAIKAGLIDPDGRASDDFGYQKAIEAISKHIGDEIDREILEELTREAQDG